MFYVFFSPEHDMSPFDVEKKSKRWDREKKRKDRANPLARGGVRTQVDCGATERHLTGQHAKSRRERRRGARRERRGRTRKGHREKAERSQRPGTRVGLPATKKKPSAGENMMSEIERG